MLHAYQMGPVKDRSRARAGRHGSLRVVEGRTLLFVGNDAKQVSITLDRGDDMIALAEELTKAGESAQLTDIAVDLTRPEEFVAPKVLNVHDSLLAALELFFTVNDAGIERGTTLGEQLAIAGFFDAARAAISKTKGEA